MDQLKTVALRIFNSIRSELIGVALFVGVIWATYIVSAVLPLNDYLSLIPRSVRGLPGILGMHFLHSSPAHIISNTFPLFLLLTLMAGSRARTRDIVLGIMFGSGILLWLTGSANTSYVGASALIFGLIGFLVTAGILEKRLVPLAISIVVGVIYGWTFIVGLLPLRKDVSEWAHFIGAITGIGGAFLTVWRPTAKTSAEVVDANSQLP